MVVSSRLTRPVVRQWHCCRPDWPFVYWVVFCNDDGDGIGYSLLQKTVVDILGRVLVDAGAAVAAGRKEAVELEIIEALPLLLLLLGHDGMGVATPVAPGVPTADGH
jgi:hypothetical protein